MSDIDPYEFSDPPDYPGTTDEDLHPISPASMTHFQLRRITGGVDTQLESRILMQKPIRLRDAIIASQKPDVELKEQAVANISGAPSVEVHVGTGREPTGE